MSTYQARKNEALRRGISSAKLLSTSALTAAGILALASSPALADNAWVLNQVGGSFDTDTSIDNVTNITQNSQRAIGEGNLDIASYQTVNIQQNSASDLFVARDNRADPTRILGSLNANGRVMVIDQNGIFFGENSTVNVGGIIASTSDVSNTSLMNDDSFEFSNFGEGSIALEGTVNVAEAGLAAFVSPVVSNNGVINAKLGKVAFAAGETVTLDLYGDGLVEIAVDGELEDALLENAGEINAEGGTVQMTAVAAKDAIDNIINVDGVVTVASAEVKGGKIILSGGSKGAVTVSGTLDASGTDGGEIEIDAQNTLTTASSEIKADGQDQAGSVVLWGRDNALYAGDISAFGENGFVETSGGNLGVWGDVSLSEGGEWLLDPTDITIVGGALNADLIPNLAADVVFSPDDTPPTPATPNADSWVWIGDAVINTALNNGVDVTFETNSNGTRDGDITVRNDAAILKTGGADSLLTFKAHDDIIIDGTITSTGPNKLSLDFQSDFDGSGGDSGITINNTISLNGGNFDATAPGDFDITAAGSVNANGGNINIDQGGVFSSVNANTLTTHTTGTITVNQNEGGSINNVINSIANGGTGANTINVGAGTYNEAVLIDRAVGIIGAGRNSTFITAPTSSQNAFTVDGAIGGNGIVRIQRFDISGANAGIRVNDTASLNRLIVGGIRAHDNANHGLAVFGDSVGRTDVVNSIFTNNGTLATTNRGQGDILFYLHHGDIALKNVTVQGNTGDVDYGGSTGVAPTADYGIQIIGSNPNEPGSLSHTAAGDISFENVNVSGNYRAALLGIQEYSEIGPLTFTDVTLGGQTAAGTDSAGWASLFLSNLGTGDINLGNTTFNAIDGNYITLGAGATYSTGNNIDATSATFEGVTGATATVAQNFAIEDKIFHKLDFAPQGLVTWKAGELFVTGNSVSLFNPFAIQNAINAASAGNTVNVDDSTYQEHITIDKALKLTGHGTTMQAINGTPLVTVTASNVNIDPITFDGGGITNFGIDARGAGALGLTVEGNRFKNFNRAGIYIEANNGDAGLTRIVGNTFEGSSTRGVQTGNLRGPNYKLLIGGNTIGAAGDEVRTGLDIGRVINANVSLEAGTINATGDAIYFRDGTFNTSSVVLYNVVATGGDEALDIQGIVRSGGTFVINGGAFNGRGNGVEFQKVDGDLTLTNVTASSTTRDAVNMLGTITGNVTINGGSYTGAVNGIGSNNGGNNIDGGKVTIHDATITGTTGDGIALGNITNGGFSHIVYNTIQSAGDAVKTGGVTDSRLEVLGNRIGQFGSSVGGNGINIDGDVSNSTVIIGHYGDASRSARAQSIYALENGVLFNGNVASGSDVQIATYIENANQDGLRFAGDIDGSTVKTGAASFTTLDGGTGAFGGFHSDAGLSGVVVAGEVKGVSTINIDSNFGIIGRGDDGIRFEKAITGASTVNIVGNVNDFGGDSIRGNDDGIVFTGINGSGTAVNINNNIGVRALNGNGIALEGTDSIAGGATVTIAGNTIVADNDGIDVNGDTQDNGTTLTIAGNTIDAGDEGIDISAVKNRAVVTIGGTAAHNALAPASIRGNIITADGNGIEFDAGIDSNVTIQNNRVDADDDGIAIEDKKPRAVTAISSGAVVQILDNKLGSIGSDSIGDDGIDVDDSITGGSTVTISGNTIGRTGRGGYVRDNGIEFDNIEGGATVNITNNPDIRAVDDGIHVGGKVEKATLNITGNNHGIHAGQHGIFFGDEVTTGAVLNIHDNIISANEDRFDGIAGNGIHFDDEVNSNADVNIGNGSGGSEDVGGSNVISAYNGIVFADDIYNSASIDIDGNRIGFTADAYTGPYDNARLSGNGIQFHNIYDDAEIEITDNHIRVSEDGVQFNGDVYGRADILIGGKAGDKNTINAENNGIEFNEDVYQNALVEISHNDIDSTRSGIRFEGNVSNVAAGGVSQEEILITNNDIDIYGDGSGIQFVGTVSDNRHDTRIANNDILVRDGFRESGDHAVEFQGDINDASVWIVNNDRLYGNRDGIAISGDVTNNGRVRIHGNTEITGEDQDGIDISGNIQSGSFVSIINNDEIKGQTTGVQSSFDNAIEIANIDNARLLIERNDDIRAADHGIFIDGIWNGSDVDIHDNVIMSNTDGGQDGAGIWVDGNVTSGSTVNIGDGTLNGEASNIITVGSNSFGSSSDLDGIRFEGTVSDSSILIDGNRIGKEKQSIVDDGIQFAAINGESTVDITDNRIYAGDDGIFFDDIISGSAKITIGETPDDADGNIIDAGDDAIEFFRDITENSQIIIFKNELTGDSNGIEFSGTTSNNVTAPVPEGQPSADIFISQNDIYGTQNGISFEGRASGRRHTIRIVRNTIEGDNGNGVQHTGGLTGSNLRIINNDSILGDENGVYITGEMRPDGRRNPSIRVSRNDLIQGGSGDGIHINDFGFSGSNIELVDNKIQFGQDGIEVSAYSAEVVVDLNEISNAAENGILLNAKGGLFSDDFSDSTFETAEVFFTTANPQSASFARVRTTGFFDGEFNSIVSNNIVTESGTNGLHVKGETHDSVVVEGNTFTDNPTGARFESGEIDISNTDNPNIFEITDTFTAPSGLPFVTGMQFELANPEFPTSLTISGETLGSTEFEGFAGFPIGDAFYVRFEDGAILSETGAVIEIDGTFASFDGLIPNNFGNILTQELLDGIENRLFDADDPALNDRGQIFVGSVPGLENIEDFFNQFAPFEGLFNGLNVTVLGMPSVTGGAAAFANINPAAGGDEPTSPEQLANIEPEAGGDDAACWGDALGSAASSGKPANFSFGGTFEESLADASACGSF